MKRNRINIEQLPVELEYEILSWLSVKDLLLCKCVCKKWHALIGSRSFINHQFHHGSHQGCLILEFFSTNLKRNEFAMYPNDGMHLHESIYLSQFRFCDILGPANGLFCAVNPLGRVAFFNPATRKMKLLPQIPLPDPRQLEFGFGVDPSSGDYKVVAFQIQKESPNFFCVYNNSSDSWRKAKVVDSLNKRVCLVHDRVSSFVQVHEQDVVLNGVYHWINPDNYPFCESILAFDLRTENFREILLPVAAKEKTIMSAYGDSIALLIEAGRCVDFWVLGRDGLWSKSFSIELPQLCDYMWPRFMWKKNELLLQSLTFTSTILKSNTKSSALFLYDMSTKELRKLGPEFVTRKIQRVFSYKESLVSIGGERDIAEVVQDSFY